MTAVLEKIKYAKSHPTPKHKRANLRQTAIHDDMSLGHPGCSIRWKPFVNTEKVASRSSDAISQLRLRVALSSDQGNQDRSIHDLVQWLKVEAPSVVRDIAIDEVLLQTQQIQLSVRDCQSHADISGSGKRTCLMNRIFESWQLKAI